MEACEVTNDFLKSEYIVLKKDVDVEDQNFVIHYIFDMH